MLYVIVYYSVMLCYVMLFIVMLCNVCIWCRYWCQMALPLLQRAPFASRCQGDLAAATEWFQGFAMFIEKTLSIYILYICDYLYVCMYIYIYLYIYVHIPGVSVHFDFHCLFCSARLKNVLSFWLVVLIQKGWVRLRAANKNIKHNQSMNICIYL